ncbi:GNAT family N-acetyltransferase [Paenibacillus lutrae]|uniref:Uncharacterized protein n=1 Tax=Paenibacillus lutrae TaxID=2078573 RepID=A0A7X3FJ49_9BACL|nr:hypothetical protein [Paenibacillus lutrae]MVP00615.1 hypothetical protein [Paenibacillus lutrae]
MMRGILLNLEFAYNLKGVPLPGIRGDSEVVQSFAEMYCRYYNVPHTIHIGMQSYVWTQVNKPLHVKGAIRWTALSKKERLQAMLYADLKNPDSNKVYRTIGFEERGKIVEIKFA